MDSREVIRKLKSAGWYEVNQVGSHKQFKHPAKKGRVTVRYPKRDIPPGTLKSIENQGGAPAIARVRDITMDYIAYLHKTATSDFGVSFPDFPGCVTTGRTLDEARRMAVEALTLHVRSMLDDGEEIPRPSTLDELAKDRAMKGSVAVLIPLQAVEKTVRVNITARQSQLEQIDRLAKEAGLTRSAYIVQSATSGADTLRKPVRRGQKSRRYRKLAS